jgi:hypothetical protein
MCPGAKQMKPKQGIKKKRKSIGQIIITSGKPYYHTKTCKKVWPEQIKGGEKNKKNE